MRRVFYTEGDIVGTQSLLVSVVAALLAKGQLDGWFWIATLATLALLWPLLVVVRMKWKGKISDENYQKLVMPASLPIFSFPVVAWLATFSERLLVAGLTIVTIASIHFAVGLVVGRIRISKPAAITGLGSALIAFLSIVVDFGEMYSLVFLIPFLLYGFMAHSFWSAWLPEAE